MQGRIAPSPFRPRVLYFIYQKPFLGWPPPIIETRYMKIDKKTPYGDIDISIEAIASIAGTAAESCYGVIGLAPRASIRDAVSEILKLEDYKKGVYVRKGKKGFEVDIYLTCAYGIKLSEILSEAQKRVKYELEKAFDIKFAKINVYAVNIKENN